jgi:hypothetical protein
VFSCSRGGSSARPRGLRDPRYVSYVLEKDRREKRERVRGKPQRWRVPGFMLFRMFVIGSVAIGASIWALYRHYSTTRPPMLVPAPSASELPAPTLEPVP